MEPFANLLVCSTKKVESDFKPDKILGFRSIGNLDDEVEVEVVEEVEANKPNLFE